MLSSPNLQKGLYPIMPILYPISATDQVPVSVVVSVLLSLLFIGVSMLVCLLMTHVMQKQSFQTHPPLRMILTGVFSLALYLRFGCSMVSVQGMILFFILLYASCSDLTTHTMDDYLWVMVGILGCLSVLFCRISANSRPYLQRNGKVFSATVMNFSILAATSKALISMFRSCLERKRLTPIPMDGATVCEAISQPITK